MKKSLIIAVGTVLLANTPAHAIDAKYRQKLERSGCTQMSEMQGCDINKTKAENAKAGFVTEAPPETAGQGAQAKRSDGALVFKQGFITYTIQGDRRLKGEDYWFDSDAKSRGPINVK